MMQRKSEGRKARLVMATRALKYFQKWQRMTLLSQKVTLWRKNRSLDLVKAFWGELVTRVELKKGRLRFTLRRKKFIIDHLRANAILRKELKIKSKKVT